MAIKKPLVVYNGVIGELLAGDSVEGGSVIKSIQRGTVTATNGGTGTVTVSAVDTAKSVLFTSVKSGTGVQGGWGALHATMASMKITNGTTLTWNGGSLYSTTGTDSVIEWQLVEYN